jgi:hypothetical protein
MQRRGVHGNATLGTFSQPLFEPDAVHAGIPYRMAPDGAVEAIIQGARVRFSDYGKFSTATGAPPQSPPQSKKPSRPPNLDRSPWAWFIFLLAIAFLVVLAASH